MKNDRDFVGFGMKALGDMATKIGEETFTRPDPPVVMDPYTAACVTIDRLNDRIVALEIELARFRQVEITGFVEDADTLETAASVGGKMMLLPVTLYVRDGDE